MRKLARSDWAGELAWIEACASPGFNWDLRKISELGDTVECWVGDGCCVFLQDLGATAEILLLATSPEKRRQGVMKALLRSLFDELSQYSEWWLEVHENNTAALELYGRLGFQATGRRPRYYADGAACVLMSRSS